MNHPAWSSGERKIFRRLSSPFKVQLFIDSLSYNITAKTYSPREVLHRGQAHCFDGALFGAAALEFLGHPPLLMDLRCNGFEDDDHVLAIFKRHGLWGAIGKSNYTGCRHRDPVFRTLRELAMSYFNIYFNLAGKKTLREYSVTFDLRAVKDIDWRTTSSDLTPLGERLNDIRHFRLIPARIERELSPADERLFRAETLGLDPRGAFKIKGARKVVI